MSTVHTYVESSVCIAVRQEQARYRTPLPPLSSLGVVEIVHGLYRYTEDLLRLEHIAWDGREAPHSSPMVSGFLPLDAWAPFLANHPD